jgi:hypothetical protein
LHPDARRPSDDGLDDSRPLAIRWSGLRVSFVKPVRQPSAAPPLGLADFARLATALVKIKQQHAKSLHRDIVSSISNFLAATADRTVCKADDIVDVADLLAFVCLREDWSFASRLLCVLMNVRAGIIVMEPSATVAPSCVVCELSKSGAWRFTFGFQGLMAQEARDVSRMVIARWLAFVPVFLTYLQSRRSCGVLILNVGDEPHARGLAFCGRLTVDEAILVPDSYFLRSGGYRALKERYSELPVDFTRRRPVALWRGSTTGQRYGGSVFALPRIRLCLRAQQADLAPYVDAGVTRFVQLESPEEKLQLQRLKIEKEPVAYEKQPGWMFLIDIDGNTSSWSGLFEKLLTGSVVLKVQSERGWRQWYYSRLVPFVHYVPVMADFSDLAAKIKYYTYNLGEAAKIGAEGRNLAMSMMYDQEVQKTLEHMESAMYWLLRLEQPSPSQG